MLGFFRDGFFKDFTVLMLVTVIIGAIFSSGVAWAVDSYFGDTIDGMIGEYGEFDIILHIREEAREAAERELKRIAAEQYPGAKVDQTITIAGQANFFFGFPEEFRTREVMESLPAIFNGIPGINGYTVIIEPSILIRGVHSSVRTELTERIEAITGVRFAFKDGVNMLVVLEDMQYSRDVTEQVNQILDEYQILELRFPIGFEVDTQLTGEEVIDIIENEFGPKLLKNVTSLEHGDDLDAFLTALVEMRNFLLSYASKVRIQADPNIHLIVGERLVVQGLSDAKIVVGEESAQDHLVIEVLAVEGQNAEGIIIEGSIAAAQDTIKQDIYRLRSDGLITERVGSVELENERYKLEYTINESLKLLHELDELAHEAHLAVDNAEAILDVFQEALIQLDLLQIQMRKLNEGITQGNAQSVGEQLIISLLLNGLFKNLAAANEEQTETPIETLENLDIEAMRSSLVNIADQIANVQEIDVQAIIYQIEHLRDSLPQMEDEDIGKSIRLINTYLAGQVIPGARVQILVEGEPLDEKVMEPIIREGLDNPYVNTYSVSAGMVNPDARSEILRLLQEIRATIAGIMAVIFTIGILILDHATIFSTLKWVLGNRRKIFTWIFGAIVGSVILTLVYILSGAEIPYVSIPVVIILGLMIGFIVVVMAEKFSPVDRNEIMAGQALGLSNVQIMREIVIPASRPGLMNLLNRWKQQF